MVSTALTWSLTQNQKCHCQPSGSTKATEHQSTKLSAPLPSHTSTFTWFRLSINPHSKGNGHHVLEWIKGKKLGNKSKTVRQFWHELFHSEISATVSVNFIIDMICGFVEISGNLWRVNGSAINVHAETLACAEVNWARTLTLERFLSCSAIRQFLLLNGFFLFCVVLSLNSLLGCAKVNFLRDSWNWRWTCHDWISCKVEMNKKQHLCEIKTTQQQWHTCVRTVTCNTFNCLKSKWR